MSPLFPTDRAAVQPRVENGSTAVWTPKTHPFHISGSQVLAQWWQVRKNSAFRAVPLARSWACLGFWYHIIFLFFLKQDLWGFFCDWNHCHATELTLYTSYIFTHINLVHCQSDLRFTALYLHVYCISLVLWHLKLEDKAVIAPVELNQHVIFVLGVPTLVLTDVEIHEGIVN